MQAQFRAKLDHDMMEFFDILQANKRPVERREIQVEVQSFKIDVPTEAVAVTPPDEIVQ